MTASLTKIQNARRFENMTARQIANKKYHDKAYRSKKSKNNLWQKMFIGKVDINELFKTYGIIP